MALTSILESHIGLLTGRIRKLTEERDQLELAKKELEAEVRNLSSLHDETKESIINSIKNDVRKEVQSIVQQEVLKGPRNYSCQTCNEQKLPRYRQEDEPLLYITHFDVVCDSLRIDMERRCERFPACLPVKTLPWYVSLPSEVKKDYHLLKEHFVKRFTINSSLEDIGREFNDLKAWNFPSMDEYASKIEELALKLKKGKEERLESFLLGLPSPHYKRAYTKEDKLTSLEEAAKFEAMFENVDFETLSEMRRRSNSNRRSADSTIYGTSSTKSSD